MIFKKSIFYFITALNALFFCACASNGDIATLEMLYYEGKSVGDSYSYSKKYADDDFLWALQSGILAYQVGEFESASEYLNGAEVFFEGVSGENAFNSGFKSFASIILSNGMFEYVGAFYESVFINHYKALNAIMSGDFQGARVEFNRANDRQRRAKDYFADYITKRDENINANKGEYSQKTQNVNLNKSYDKATEIYGTHYQNLRAYRAFEGYVNPYISYISGIFFLAQKDFDKASDLLKESYAITGQKEILGDIAILENRKRNLVSERTKSYTWIIIEEGRIPKKEEIRFDLPLFFVNANVLSFNIALPILRESYAYSTNYNIKKMQDSNRQSILEEKSGLRSHEQGNKTERLLTKRVASLPDFNPKDEPVAFQIADISPLVANEFEMELPYTIITALLSSSYKAYLQYFLGEKLGFLGSLAGAVFSYATSNADIRSARILPLRFYAMRFLNQNGDFALHNGTYKLRDFAFDSECKSLCANSDNIIYARIIQNDIISLLIHSLNKEQKNDENDE